MSWKPAEFFAGEIVRLGSPVTRWWSTTTAWPNASAPPAARDAAGPAPATQASTTATAQTTKRSGRRPPARERADSIRDRTSPPLLFNSSIPPQFPAGTAGKRNVTLFGEGHARRSRSQGVHAVAEHLGVGGPVPAARRAGDGCPGERAEPHRPAGQGRPAQARSPGAPESGGAAGRRPVGRVRA